MLQKYQGDKLGNLPDYLIIFQIFTRFSTPIKIFVFKELVRGKVKCGYVKQIPSHKNSFTWFPMQDHSISARGRECFGWNLK